MYSMIYQKVSPLIVDYTYQRYNIIISFQEEHTDIQQPQAPLYLCESTHANVCDDAFVIRLRTEITCSCATEFLINSQRAITIHYIRMS
jgi:hypothetical protein